MEKPNKDVNERKNQKQNQNQNEKTKIKTKEMIIIEWFKWNDLSEMII